MRTFRRLMERIVSGWLAPIVETEGHLPSLWATTPSESQRFCFTVLTPAVQRALDQSG